MCQLLGMCFSQPFTPSISFRGFRHKGESNPNGWGIAFYPDKAAQVIKEPLKAGKSILSEFIQDYPNFRSKIIIAHVRKATEGSESYMNTHPFIRELNGKEYVFIHNGSLPDYHSLPLDRFRPVGETDSEHSFCYLLSYISGIDIWNTECFNKLHNKLSGINELGKFNCMFSDGEYLFCYFDKKKRGGLSFVLRKFPFRDIKLKDENYEIHLPLVKDEFQSGYIIATEPLTNENWTTFCQGELIVFRKGKMIFSTHHKILSTNQIDILSVLRNSRHKLMIRELCNYTGIQRDIMLNDIEFLLDMEYIKQDARDEVNWDDERASYYTRRQKRKDIDRLI